MPKIRLLIASAHVIVRTALGTLLKAVQDFDVVGEIGLSQLVKTPEQLSPDVLLVELTEAGLPGPSGG
jgi:DNA-binding NarL/FixJ family response regulator